MNEQLSDADMLLASIDQPERFTDLVRRWSEPLLAYFYRRTFDAEVSLDLLAETLSIAFERRSRYRPSSVPAISWAYGIARRELSRYRRRRAVELRAAARLGIEVPAIDDDSFRRIDELVDAEQFRSALRDALAQLTDKERAAVELRVLDDQQYTAVALALGCSEGTARVRVHRGLSRIADLLEEA